ncbi:MAG: hypothetical protein BWY57_01684 [Betaproteobacteria bacterium ADurb.Bin341]|nr:MAG: hypothetical protein BWY57_01684 [Betaproteobacteria bacterium ADurb.Bin341]
MRPVTPSRRKEKKRSSSSTVHQPPPQIKPTPARDKRRFAKSVRSANHLPGPAGINPSPAPASERRKAARTSSPTSNDRGPMAGPNQAINSSAGHRILATVRSRMPAARLRQPACAAAATVPRRSQSNTGRQSAVITTQTRPGACATAASASVLQSATSASSTAMPSCALAATAGWP